MIPQHYRALMDLHSSPDEITNVPFNALVPYNQNLGALGLSFKKIKRAVSSAAKTVAKPVASVAKAVAKPVAAAVKPVAAVAKPVAKVVKPVAKVAKPIVRGSRAVARPVGRITRNVVKPVVQAAVRAPVNIVKTAAQAAPNIVKAAVVPVASSVKAVAQNPLSVKNWVNVAVAPVKSQINIATGTTNAAVAVAKDAAQPVRTLTASTGIDKLATKVAQATKLDKVGNAIATGAVITSVVANDMIAKGAGLAPLVPSPLPRSPQAEELAEDVAYVEQQEQVAEAMADAADRAAAAGDVEATAVLAERAREAAKNAQEGQKDVVESAKAAIDAGNNEGNVAAAILTAKTRAAAEAKQVIAKIAKDAKAGTLPPGMSPAARRTVDVTPKPGVAGKAMGAGAGALVGTMFLPGIGTAIGAAAGWLFGQQADTAGAKVQRRQQKQQPVAGLRGVQWDPSTQQWRYR